MIGSAVIETAIGLAFMFFLVSIFCSAVVEAIANLFKKRAKYLLRGLKELLDSSPQSASGAGTMMTWLRTTARTDSGKAENMLYEAALGGTPSAESNAAAGQVQPQPGAVLAPPTQPAGPLQTGVQPPAGDQPPPGTQAKPAGTAVPPAAGKDWVVELMSHALVRPYKQSTATGETIRNPSYLPAKTFAAALLDMIHGNQSSAAPAGGPGAAPAAESDVMATLHVEVGKLGGALGDAMRGLIRAAGDDLGKLTASIESWYDSQMEAVGAAYKRWAKRWLIVFGLAVALFLHVDAIAIGKALYTQAPLRDSVVAAATNATLCQPDKTFEETKACVTKELGDLGALGVPVGWSGHTLVGDLGKPFVLVGIALTAWAATFGGPFWFDVLNRFGSIRNAGRKPEKSA